MITGNYYSDNELIKFYFENMINWDDIVPNLESGFKDAAEYEKTQDARFEFAPNDVASAVEGYSYTMEAIGDVAGNHLAPKNKEISHTGLKLEDGKVKFPPAMVDNINKIIEAGILPYSTGREYGGLQLPFSLQAMFLEIVGAANPALGLTVGCYNLAEVIEEFGSKEMAAEWVPKMSAGEYIGAMALTEPDYGSNLPEVQTRAEQDADGNWKITGTKIFITHGCGFDDKEAAILTLARSSDKPGAKGLSFFLVKSSDIEVVRIEEKLGIHSSPTCQIAYDNSPAELIGEEGKGLVKYSMAMMNGARLAVAAQGMGISQAAYNEGKKYAEERIQFGKPIKDIPAVNRLLKNMEMEVFAQRALLYETSYHVDMLRGLQIQAHDAGQTEKELKANPDFRYYDKMCKFLTPLVKFYTSEECNNVAYDAIQIHGGGGYTDEYDVAGIYADARITAIYEGTSQLQVVAAIGSIVSGLGGKSGGILADYFDKLVNDIPNLDPALKDAVGELTQLVHEYKELEKETKEEMSWELVYSAAGLLNSLLLAKLGAHEKAPENYAAVAERYKREFFAKFAASKVRIRTAAPQAVPV